MTFWKTVGAVVLGFAIAWAVIGLIGTAYYLGERNIATASTSAGAGYKPAEDHLQSPLGGTDTRCTVPGSVYVAAADACVLRITDPVQVQAVVPDQEHDPDCDGKPDGFKFDRKVIGPDGREGIAHMVCGRR